MSALEQFTQQTPFPGYISAPGSYDEIVDSRGGLRCHWKRFVESSAGLTAEEFGRRWSQAQRLLRENSLAHPEPATRPVHGDHPWALDALPLMIAGDEWQTVSSALQQRARLLDLTLRDLYGPQRLLTENILPPEVVFRHPGFQLPYCEARPAEERLLHFYAADLARSPDGTWWVIADRCEAPSGAGFALQNRIASSRILPDVIHACQVERLAPFFLAVRRQMTRLSQRGADARVILLSQAAGSDNYLEDAFLARYLGYPLAEAGDLAVRDQRLHLKTLGGLSPVDVLIRRPNSEECDPLELSTTASFGVAGLVQSWHSGQVAIANSLGSGLIESPIFMAFLPKICRALLGEPLAMPGVATFWCGDPTSLARVLDQLDQLSVKPAYRRRGLAQTQAQRLSEMDHDRLRRLILRDPAAFVAQERVVRSSVPVWANSQFQQSFIALRSFAVADNDDYTVMPGALSRVSSSLTPLELSLLAGEHSKDTWVLADGPVKQVTLLKTAGDDLELRRGGVDLPSRAAEHFYWLGRHAVRAEISGKLLRAVTLRLTREEDTDEIPELPVLLRILAERGQIEPGFVVDVIKDQLPAIESALPAAVFDDQQPGTMRSTVSELVFLSSTVRDLMSIDTWRIIRQMNVDSWPNSESQSLLPVLDQLETLLLQLAAFGGHVSESMTRTHAWRFLDLGRRLERSMQISSILRTVLEQDQQPNYQALEALLEIFDGVMTYRSRYHTRVELGPVLDLLLQDESNPRSLAYQLALCATHVSDLPSIGQEDTQRTEQSLADGILNHLRNMDLLSSLQPLKYEAANPLINLLTIVEVTLPELSNVISHKYFFHAGPTQHRL